MWLKPIQLTSLAVLSLGLVTLPLWNYGSTLQAQPPEHAKLVQQYSIGGLARNSYQTPPSTKDATYSRDENLPDEASEDKNSKLLRSLQGEWEAPFAHLVGSKEIGAVQLTVSKDRLTFTRANPAEKSVTSTWRIKVKADAELHDIDLINDKNETVGQGKCQLYGDNYVLVICWCAAGRPTDLAIVTQGGFPTDVYLALNRVPKQRLEGKTQSTPEKMKPIELTSLDGIYKVVATETAIEVRQLNIDKIVSSAQLLKRPLSMKLSDDGSTVLVSFGGNETSKYEVPSCKRVP